MDKKIQIFISYSHQDAAYLDKDSLFGFLKGLTRDNIEFWTDLEILPGEPWDQVIKNHIQSCDIALVLVSQSFLDSDYCRNVEIESFLAGKKHLFPVILSPCDWQRHEWLASRQFLPGGEQTVVEDFCDEGKRKRLFLQIREYLLQRAQIIRGAQETIVNQPMKTTSPAKNASFSGKTKIKFCNSLLTDWRKLADYFEISPADQARFSTGDEGRDIWCWLEIRGRLNELPDALFGIDRSDLARLFTSSL